MLWVQKQLGEKTKISFSVYLSLGPAVAAHPVGHVHASSAEEAFRDLVKLLRNVATELERTNLRGEPSTLVVPEGTETATYGRTVEDVDILTDPADRRD